MPLFEYREAMDMLDEHIPHIQDSIVSGWGRWKSLPADVRVDATPRSRASIVHDFIVSHAAKKMNAKVHDYSDMKLFLLGNKVALRFKKLDGNLLSRNQPTGQVRDFRAQGSLSGIPSLHNLEAGYILDDLDQEIDGIHIVCPNGKSNYWSVSIGEGEIRATDDDLFSDSRLNQDDDIKPASYKRKEKDSGIIVPFKIDV